MLTRSTLTFRHTSPIRRSQVLGFQYTVQSIQIIQTPLLHTLIGAIESAKWRTVQSTRGKRENPDTKE